MRREAMRWWSGSASGAAPTQAARSALGACWFEGLGIDVPELTDTEVVAAEFRIHVVVEHAFASVCEHDTHQTGAARDGRGHFLNDRSLAPLTVVAMLDAVAEAEI